ncbi:MAG: HDOD domain-containing protein [Desulfobulbaceae bacterium]|uniref:HDOD domain-containing protein n=1 Tax=Candidatus Desulfobia pelagia TaxID=2841692 RepID=A0A8J6NE79_9BACT|nr:HDOD domain-containing protein [Candidatus Desulfobia pelagia]
MATKRVLFVDDEPNILSGMKRMLRSLRNGLDMSFAESGKEALELMKDEPFDIVVSDMRMPGMDGAELLTEIRKQYPETIRIMLTGQADSGSVMRTVTVAHQFLAKPCEPERLKTTLHRACLLHNLLSHPVMRKVVANIDTLPSLPEIYIRVQDLLADPDSSVDDVAKCIARDIGMSAKILQLVNSAFFGLFQHIESPAQAVHLLGLDTIKSLVLTVKIFSQYDEAQGVPSLRLEDLWEHSMMVGAYARKITEQQTSNQKIIDDAFIAGLQHDLGKLVLLANMPEKYQEALDLAARENIPVYQAESKIFQATHAEIGAYLLGLWGFPAAVIEAIVYHHKPLKYPGDSFDTVVAVHAANAFAHENKSGAGGGHGSLLDTEFLVRVNCEDRIDSWREACRQDLGENDNV